MGFLDIIGDGIQSGFNAVINPQQWGMRIAEKVLEKPIQFLKNTTSDVASGIGQGMNSIFKALPKPLEILGRGTLGMALNTPASWKMGFEALDGVTKQLPFGQGMRNAVLSQSIGGMNLGMAKDITDHLYTPFALSSGMDNNTFKNTLEQIPVNPITGKIHQLEREVPIVGFAGNKMSEIWASKKLAKYL